MSGQPPAWFSLDARVVSALPPSLDAGVREFWEGGGPLPGQPARSITLEVGELPGPPPEAAVRLPLMGREVVVAVAGDRLWVDDRLWARAALPGQAAASRVVCLPGGAAPEAWALVFTELHRAGGWLPLHAAVVAAGDRAVAVTGASGAGKSTAALRLHAASLGQPDGGAGGPRVLAEDRAFWHAPSGVVVGLDRQLRAYADSLERFAPQLLPLARAQAPDAHGKLRLPLPGWPGRAPHLDRVLPLGPADARLDLPGRVRAVWEMTGVPLTAPARAAVQAGVGRLLPLLCAHPHGREEVIPAVRALLTPLPES